MWQHSLGGLVRAFRLLSAMAIGIGIGPLHNLSAQELTPSQVELRGSKDFRETVDLFLNRKAPKIVGGLVAPDGAFPWQVSLVVSWIGDAYRGHFCGGSILNERWIVTAAHCVDGNTAQDIHIVFGTNVLSEQSRRQNVQRIIAHKQYNRRTFDNDIALLELWEAIPLDVRTKAIVLLDAKDEERLLAPSQNLTVTGWGATKQGGRSVKDLRLVDVPSVTRMACNAPPSYDGKITENMICAGFALGGADACQGDSGGPLVTAPVEERRLAGIVSWGEGCAKPGKFGVYTRVSRYADWIAQCAQPSSKC